MKNLLALFLILCLCIFIGCLGMSGSSGSLGGPGGQVTSAILSGRVYFADRQLYGGIPIAVRDLIGHTVTTVLTDSAGYFAFPQLAAGLYDLVALTGESEVIFSRGVQVDGVNQQQIAPTQLLGIRDVVVDEIGANSFHVKFRSNMKARASIEYGPLGGYQQNTTLGQAGVTTHETTISGLNPLTDYEISLFLTGDDGQDFVMRGLFAATTGFAGPENLSVAINEGAYETKTQNVTLYLNAENCSHMRISESFDMADTYWVTYSPTYSYSFKTSSAGTKRIYVQFRDADGITSTIQSDAILMNQSGYVGIWINDGAAITNKTDAVVKTVFPGSTHMQLSNTADFLNSFWEVYGEVKNWKLSSVDGLKNIYCRFRGGQANPEEVFTASILLDTTPPEVLILINNGDTVTATNTVTITFSFSVAPTQMKLTNTTAPTTSIAWIPFKDTLSWVLPSGDGEKTVYGTFRDGAGNEYGPVSAKIDIDSVAPTGNTISLRETDETTSGVATFALIASLPVYLHLDTTDTSTYQAHYAVTAATTTPPVALTSVSSPFSPVPLDSSLLPVGTHKVWTRFTDKAGNPGFFQSANIKIDGPQLLVSPTTATLESGEEEQFNVTLKNIDMQDVGAIKWRVINGLGEIDNTGLFTAPAPVYTNSISTIRADSTLIPSLFSDVTVNLATTVEMLFQQRDGNITYDPISDQVAPGQSISIAIKILHSNRGFEISKLPGAGTVAISAAVATTYGMIATLTYSAPAIAPAANPVTIGVRSLDAPTTAIGTITLLISTGPNLAISPTSGDAQRNRPLAISANVTGTSANTMTWSISPTNLGSFDPDNPLLTTTTTVAPHSVSFYASSPLQIRQASVTANIDGASKTCKISVYPPIRFQIEPAATSSLPIVTPMTFKAQGFDYLLGNATETVTWEFKNSAFADFMAADGKTYLDRGSLKVIDATTAEYRRPSILPSISDPAAADSVIIRATSVADPTASATAISTISTKVVVEIFDKVERVTPIASAATVAEVGKLQFYANVTPSVIGNTSVTWTVNGTSGSTQYGTIDSNGLYTAPDQVFVNEVTIRATSNYDTTAYAAVTVNLSDFWLPKRSNMFDTTTGEVMPITSLLVNPYSAVGDSFVVYAGTSGYGVWVATFSDTAGDTTGGNWVGIPDLSVTTKNTSGRYLIGHLTISPDQHVYAGTSDGIWYIPSGTPAERVTGNIPANNLPDLNFLRLAFDVQNQQFLFATTPRGVYKITLSTPQTCIERNLFINTVDTYKDSEIESRTDSTASPPVTVSAYSNVNNGNPINGILHTIIYDEYNDRLYAGGEAGTVLYMNDSPVSDPTPNLDRITALAFVANAPSVATANLSFHLLTINQPRTAVLTADPLDLAIDLVNRNTLWAATVGGVYRSVNNGMSWTARAFGSGSTVNTRTIIVDPTNTINVLAGSEDGLYRSTDAGAAWKRIRSGLGNHKTITSLIQASGLAGARRKVWVGTAGGVFMGKQSLDLE